MSKLLHTEQQLLHDWAVQVKELFNGEMCYQVGSSLVYEKYRDIDVRTMLDAKDFKKLQKLVNVDRLNLAVSLWGQKVTGMPIDFQVQDIEYANLRHTGMRSAVGIGGIARGDGYADTKLNDLVATYSKASTEPVKSANTVPLPTDSKDKEKKL